MWNALLLSFLFLSLPFTPAVAATNKNSVASSMARLDNRVPPKINAAAPHLVTPSPSPIKPFNRQGGYYSLGGSQRFRSVPLPSISNSSAPLVRPNQAARAPLTGGGSYAGSQTVRERRKPLTPPKVGFSANALRLRSHQH